MKRQKKRVDQLLVEKGLCESGQVARRMIMAGKVSSGGRILEKAGTRIAEDSELRVEEGERYVGRGALKLEKGLSHFRIDPTGMTCLDIGASTGGFTDCLLQAGAARVYAVDCGHGQLHWRIRTDERVVVMEKCNARYLAEQDIGEKADLLVMDVSFISVTKILPAVLRILRPGAPAIVLVKPQFELERGEVGKGGVVRDEGLHAKAVENIRSFATQEAAMVWIGVAESPVKGADGNKEFLACLRNASES